MSFQDAKIGGEWSGAGANQQPPMISGFRFVTRSIQDTIADLMLQLRYAGVNAIYYFLNGVGFVILTNATEEALGRIKLPARKLETDAKTAIVDIICVKLEFNSKTGSPVQLVAGRICSSPDCYTSNVTAAQYMSIFNTTGVSDNNMTIVSTMNIASQKRRKDAALGNEHYVVIRGEDADEATAFLADLYSNPNLNTTGVEKTFAVALQVSL